MKLEELKNRDQVNMYGGLGKVGLDYAGKKSQENLLNPDADPDNLIDENENEVPAFSGSAKMLIRAKISQLEEE